MNKFEIVEPEDVDDCDCVVCRRLTQPLIEPDNLIDICCKCGEAVQHRPNAPKHPKICDACALPEVKADAAKGELHMMISPKTAAAIDAYLHKKRAH